MINKVKCAQLVSCIASICLLQRTSHVAWSIKTLDFFYSYDYLEIVNDKKQIVGKYCGQKTGQNVFLTGDKVSITFYSDESTQGGGFVIYFTAVSHCTYKHSYLLFQVFEILLETDNHEIFTATFPRSDSCTTDRASRQIKVLHFLWLPFRI